MPLLRTTLLNAEPAGTLASLDELFALANAMEQEAATKYTELAEAMRQQGRLDLVEVFSGLAAAEREHINSVTKWSQSRRGKMPDRALVRWDAPPTFDRDATTEITASKLMTPYRALAMAVRSEERAFAFWSYLAAFSSDPEVKTAAEAMASEELGHVAILRKARRRAYHRERDAGASARAEQRIDAGVLERRLAGQFEQLEGGLDPALAGRMHDLAEEARSMSAQAEGIGRFPADLEQRDAETIAEALADAYLEGAEKSDDPGRLETLQALAGRSVARLAWLRSLSA